MYKTFQIFLLSLIPRRNLLGIPVLTLSTFNFYDPRAASPPRLLPSFEISDTNGVAPW